MTDWFSEPETPTAAAVLDRYRILRKADAGWKLLRYRSAPLLFALVETAFATEMQVDCSAVERAIMELLPYWKEEDAEDGEVPDRDWIFDGESRQRATRYLNEWIQNGWFFEENAKISLASATRVCCNFMRGMGRGDILLSDSSLSTLFGMLKEFAFELNENTEEKVRYCEERSGEWLERARLLRDQDVAVQMDALTFKNRFLEIEQYITMMDTSIGMYNDNILKWREEFRQMIFDPDGEDSVIARRYYDKADELKDSPEGRNFTGFLRMIRDMGQQAAHRQCLQDILQSRRAEDAARLDDSLSGKMQDAERMFDRLLEKAGLVNESQNSIYHSAIDWLSSRQYAEDQRLLRLVRHLLDLAGRIDDASSVSMKQSLCSGLTVPYGPISFLNPVALTFAKVRQIRPVDIAVQTNDSSMTPDEFRRLGGIDYAPILAAMSRELDIRDETTLAGLLAAIRFDRFEEMLTVMRIGFDWGEHHEGNEDCVDVAFADGTLRNVRCPHVVLRKGLIPDNAKELYHE